MKRKQKISQALGPKNAQKTRFKKFIWEVGTAQKWTHRNTLPRRAETRASPMQTKWRRPIDCAISASFDGREDDIHDKISLAE